MGVRKALEEDRIFKEMGQRPSCDDTFDVTLERATQNELEDDDNVFSQALDIFFREDSGKLEQQDTSQIDTGSMRISHTTEEQSVTARQYVQSMREFENEALQDKPRHYWDRPDPSSSDDIQKEQQDINQISEDEFENSSTHGWLTKEVFLSDWPDFVVTEATREAAKKNPRITDVRLRRGMFRTDEEEEERRRLLRKTPLPGDELGDLQEEKPKVRKKSLWKNLFN